MVITSPTGQTPATASLPKVQLPIRKRALLTHSLSTVILYTNHVCPWAHRAHITLRALKIPYEEVIIPLDRPREPWYLKVNPRGLVPSIKISNGILEDEIITESAIVSTFIADLYPNSSFWPASRESPTSALTRARMTFFVDTFIGKVNGSMYQVLKAEDEEKERLGAELVEAVRKEIEPLLEDAGPFFGGSKSITLAEVCAWCHFQSLQVWKMQATDWTYRH